IANILRELNVRDTNFILRRFDKNYTGKIKQVLKYKEGTAGALMKSDFLAVSRHATVKSIVSQFQKMAKQGSGKNRKSSTVKEEAQTSSTNPGHGKLEDMQFTFVVDRDNKFLGYIPIRKLILEKPSARAAEIMLPAQVVVAPHEDQESVAQVFKNYNLLSLPVVDSRGILLGQITVDDVVDVLEEEATEDILRLGGVTQDAPQSQSLMRMARGRFPWLAINLGMQVLSAYIVTFFNETLAQVIILAPLMTVISGQGGNATMQSITVVVRSLALGQINARNIAKIISKEVAVSAMNGLLCGSLTAGVVYAYTGRPLVAFCIVFAMFCDMLFAGLVGSTLPLILKAARIDPALASGPLGTTMADICGFSVFLGTATILLQRFGAL
ncbi:MAG TPA: magnesium transporter, partial [Turneriella sp.]|nr:magnesium transporter [Turneriella sp.]